MQAQQQPCIASDSAYSRKKRPLLFTQQRAYIRGTTLPYHSHDSVFQESYPLTGINRESLLMAHLPRSVFRFQSYLPQFFSEGIFQPVIPLSDGSHCVLLFIITFVLYYNKFCKGCQTFLLQAKGLFIRIKIRKSTKTFIKQYSRNLSKML